MCACVRRQPHPSGQLLRIAVYACLYAFQRDHGGRRRFRGASVQLTWAGRLPGPVQASGTRLSHRGAPRRWRCDCHRTRAEDAVRASRGKPTSNRRPFSHTLRSSMGQDRYRYRWSGHRSERHFVSINVQGALPPCDSREWLLAAPARCMIQRLNESSTYCSKRLFEVGTRRVLSWTFCLVAVPRNQGAMT